MDVNMQKRNLTLLTDFYEITMSNGYFEEGMKDKIAVFDMFFRKVPDKGGFAIFAGLEQVIDYLKNLKFTQEDIQFLKDQNCFSDGFLDYLRDFNFECDVWSFEEGTPIFPGEPIVKVRGPIIQAQFVETMLLLLINHQSLIATKANRMVRAAKGRSVLEFGSRRAQGADAAVMGARATYIGGCTGTACTINGREFGMPVVGTMAHSWVQMFDSEYESFVKYAELYPDNCILLVDTYNVLKSGVPNAIKVFNDVILPKGLRPKGIRIDSGDIAYLSKRARVLLDEAGFEDVKITASNSLDEYLIRNLLIQGAKLDSFGIGENLITSKSSPVFGGVYKLSAIMDKDGSYIPKIKVSESVEKITNPGFKMTYRLYNKDNMAPVADYIALDEETLNIDEPITIFDPISVWKIQTLENVIVKPMLVPVFVKGKCVYESPDLKIIREKCLEQVDKLWEEIKRFDNPHKYYVDLSKELWQLKQDMVATYSK